MTLLAEGLLAMRGCWRLLWRDPAAFEDFNLTIDGFWRSFAMIVPVLVLAYPLFLSGYRLKVEFAVPGESLPEWRPGINYAFLIVGFALWPIAAALLARILGVTRNYVRYMVIYNWMSVPMIALLVIPSLFHLAAETANLVTILISVAYFFSFYVSWFVAKAGLETSALIAFAFLLAEIALTYGLAALTG